MAARSVYSSSVPSLPPPCPKSPPEYPDLYGKRREIAKIHMLEREIDVGQNISDAASGSGYADFLALICHGCAAALALDALSPLRCLAAVFANHATSHHVQTAVISRSVVSSPVPLHFAVETSRAVDGVAFCHYLRSHAPMAAAAANANAAVSALFQNVHRYLLVASVQNPVVTLALYVVGFDPCSLLI
ncbi:hypothetical protein SDJN03_16653, partial [Cucurbita argyrosperma subsp. sororia]